MTYEELQIEADNESLIVKEKSFRTYDGRIKGKKIFIRRDIPTQIQKACVLAEELGHYHTTVGDILLQSTTADKKQEYTARLWAYKKMITLDGLIKAYEYGCQNIYEISEYLNVSEEFLKDALETYRSKYGTGRIYNGYIIYFEPYLGIAKTL